jgi:Eco57I restriction-modification methylase
VRRKAEAYRALIENDPTLIRLRRACNAWTAAFFASRGSGQERTAPTTADVWNALAGCQNPQRAALIAELSDHFHFYHWRLEFPEVFERGGFDVMLGNPPWEVSQFSDVEYFESRRPEIAKLTGAARKRAITQLRGSDPTDWVKFIHEKRAGEAFNEFARECGRFSLTISGKLNTYALFAEHFSQLLRPTQLGDSRGGLILPTGIATEKDNSAFFRSLTERHLIASILSFFEIRRWFRGTDDRKPFCILTLAGGSEEISFAVDIRHMAELRDPRKRFELGSPEIALINPNTRNAPFFRSRADADLTTSGRHRRGVCPTATYERCAVRRLSGSDRDRSMGGPRHGRDPEPRDGVQQASCHAHAEAGAVPADPRSHGRVLQRDAPPVCRERVDLC